MHIGIPKTGSSSIQHSLGNSKELLNRNGFLYPVFSMEKKGMQTIYNHSVPFVSLCWDKENSYHINVKNGFTTRDSVAMLHSKYIHQIRQQLKEFRGDKLIVSGEGLVYLGQEGLQKLRKLLVELIGNTVHISIIAYVRHPVNWAKSMIQQRVHGGHLLEDALKRSIPNVSNIFQNSFERFLQVFRYDEFRIMRFEDTLGHPCGPVGQFLSLIEFPGKQLPQMCILRQNESLCTEAVQVISAINNKYPIIKDDKPTEIRKGFNLDNFFSLPGQPLKLSMDLQRKLWDASESDREWLYQHFNIQPWQFSEDEEYDPGKLWQEDSKTYLQGILPDYPEPIQNVMKGFL